MDNIAIQKLIDALHSIRQNPEKYMSNDPHAILDFIHGFDEAAFALLGEAVKTAGYQLAEGIITGRGWKMAFGNELLAQMQAKQMTAAQITAEMLTLEIEVWQKLLE